MRWSNGEESQEVLKAGEKEGGGEGTKPGTSKFSQKRGGKDFSQSLAVKKEPGGGEVWHADVAVKKIGLSPFCVKEGLRRLLGTGRTAEASAFPEVAFGRKNWSCVARRMRGIWSAEEG